MLKPTINEGQLTFDDRGGVSFFDFGLEGIKRFYIVWTNKAGFVRAWHGHQKEAKYITAIKGSVMIGVFPVDNWEEPNMTPHKIKTFVLSAVRPEILYIPPGYANGIKFITEDARILVFSTLTLENSVNDDFRWPANKWNIWMDSWR